MANTVKIDKDTLNRVAPLISKVAVFSPDPLDNFIYLDLDKVCYITTRNALGEAAETLDTHGGIVFVCNDGSKYTNNSSLAYIVEKLETEAGNPWFMKTAKSYVINLKRIVRTRVNDARDVYFEGIEEPVINAISHGPDCYTKFIVCPYFLRHEDKKE